MNTLYFVKFRNRTPTYDTIVFCLTATSEEEAVTKGLNLISLACVKDYDLERVESICNTSDEVRVFEPC